MASFINPFREKARSGFGFFVFPFFVGLDVGVFVHFAAIAAVA